MSFSLITGIGHCGTKWLSTVLNRPHQGVICYHELSHLTTIPQWQARQPFVRQKGVGKNAIPRYWKQISADMNKYKFVCDSMSWCSLESVKVGAIGNADKIIYLVRDSIQQLYSVANNSIWKNVPDEHFLYQGFLKAYWEIAGKPYKPWGKWNRWEKLCLWCATNEFMPGWMEKNFWGDIEVYCLEDLITDVNLLSRVTKSYGLEFDKPTLRKLQGNDVNRKVQGDRRPATLWARWTPEQRKAFREICGKGMAKYGYSQDVLSG